MLSACEASGKYAGSQALEKRRIDRCGGAKVTFVGFGALEIGRDWGMGPNTSRPEAEEAVAVVGGVLDLGINVLDTASAYLLSEERIGQAAAARRGEYFLASKCGEYSNYEEQTTSYDFSYASVTKSIDNSLKLLQVGFRASAQRTNQIACLSFFICLSSCYYCRWTRST